MKINGVPNSEVQHRAKKLTFNHFQQKWRAIIFNRNGVTCGLGYPNSIQRTTNKSTTDILW
jgi:hypothetical protein